MTQKNMLALHTMDSQVKNSYRDDIMRDKSFLKNGWSLRLGYLQSWCSLVHPHDRRPRCQITTGVSRNHGKNLVEGFDRTWVLMRGVFVGCHQYPCIFEQRFSSPLPHHIAWCALGLRCRDSRQPHLLRLHLYAKDLFGTIFMIRVRLQFTIQFQVWALLRRYTLKLFPSISTVTWLWDRCETMCVSSPYCNIS